MEPELFDCSWCGSARSIDHGLCQVCLMEYPQETLIIRLPEPPRATRRKAAKTQADLSPPSAGAVE